MARGLSLFVSISALVAAAAAQPCVPEWCDVGSAFTLPYTPTIRTFARFDDGTGEKLYAGGLFSELDGQPAENLAVFDGRRWIPVLPGTDDEVRSLRVLDDGTGPALYVGGRFRNAGGQPAMLLAKFDGTSWTPIPGLTPDPRMPGWETIYDALVWDRGTGPELYVAGFFGLPGLPESVGVAKLTDAGFERLGSGVARANPVFLAAVGCLRVIDLGNGPALYVGGSFGTAGGVTARNIARWDGNTWSALGSGLPEYGGDGGLVLPTVISILPGMDGDHPTLLASGDFSLNGVRGVARWDGATWTTIPGDFLPHGPGRISILGEGASATLYAYGLFTAIDGQESSGIAVWDGATWSNLGPPITNHAVSTIIDVVDDRGPAIFVGGRDFFGSPTWAPAARLGVLIGDVTCDGAVSLADLAVVLSAFGVSDAGDLDGDGQTTLEDLTILLSKFGNDCGG